MECPSWWGTAPCGGPRKLAESFQRDRMRMPRFSTGLIWTLSTLAFGFWGYSIKPIKILSDSGGLIILIDMSDCPNCRNQSCICVESLRSLRESKAIELHQHRINLDLIHKLFQYKSSLVQLCCSWLVLWIVCYLFFLMHLLKIKSLYHLHWPCWRRWIWWPWFVLNAGWPVLDGAVHVWAGAEAREEWDCVQSGADVGARHTHKPLGPVHSPQTSTWPPSPPELG